MVIISNAACDIGNSALGIKLIVLVLGACGLASMWAAVFADVGVSVIAILNAIRALHVKNEQENMVLATA